MTMIGIARRKFIAVLGCVAIRAVDGDYIQLEMSSAAIAGHRSMTSSVANNPIMLKSATVTDSGIETASTRVLGCESCLEPASYIGILPFADSGLSDVN
jgi:hypothetical protein